jgi:hypothetical protein
MDINTLKTKLEKINENMPILFCIADKCFSIEHIYEAEMGGKDVIIMSEASLLSEEGEK